MRYTSYFATVIKDNGQPKFSAYQFQRFMNIVYLEGELNGIKRIKKSLTNTSSFYKYDVLLFKIEKQLTDLTGNFTPDQLLKEMLSLNY
jgi:hypothetical protein